jgi:tetratricopeptide (TPR) repeat protein
LDYQYAEDKNTSIKDIEIAEEYYRKAVALTSQSKSFDSERENLQNAYNNLLVLKYTQIAKANLEDKNQTVTSIANAVSYLKKAVNSDSENTDLISYLKNAEDYQLAFNRIIYLDWDNAITYLDRIAVSEPNFANGNTRLMRYEAYYALGKQFSSVGLYLDAINKFEQAEILAWSDSDNLIKLFQVQVILGDTLGKLNNYEDAVSYYEYALNVIQDSNWQVNYPEITSNLADAKDLINSRKFEDAFNSFQEVLENIDEIYSLSEIEINGGVCLALFASENLSTVDAILKANNLPESMILTFGQKLSVPMIEK